MTTELGNEEIQSFAEMLDRDYEAAMKACVGFVIPCSNLLPMDRFEEYYVQFRNKFPRCHYNFSLIASSRYYSIPSDTTPDDGNELHRKQHNILLLFFGLIRTKSNRLLSHWAQVDSFGHFFKGHQQPGR